VFKCSSEGCDTITRTVMHKQTYYMSGGSSSTANPVDVDSRRLRHICLFTARLYARRLKSIRKSISLTRFPGGLYQPVVTVTISISFAGVFV